MSSRGAKISIEIPTFEYKTIEIYQSGAKVLKGTSRRHHSLPDYSHSPNSVYIKYDENGYFKEIRFYGPDHKSFLEIAHHPEPVINNGNRHDRIWHYHIITENFKRIPAQPLSSRPDLIEKYYVYLKEVGYDD